MTKYILAGGHPRNAFDSGRAFIEAFSYERVLPIKILVCYFAGDDDKLAAKWAADQALFARFLPLGDYQLELAVQSSFVQQLANCDTVYFKGGNAERLIEVLSKMPDWTSHITGKLVVGTAAGAEMLSRYYFDLDQTAIRLGFNLLPIKVLVHYRSNYNGQVFDWNRIEQDLIAYHDTLPLHRLAEGAFEQLIVEDRR